MAGRGGDSRGAGARPGGWHPIGGWPPRCYCLLPCRWCRGEGFWMLPRVGSGRASRNKASPRGRPWHGVRGGPLSWSGCRSGGPGQGPWRCSRPRGPRNPPAQRSLGCLQLPGCRSARPLGAWGQSRTPPSAVFCCPLAWWLLDGRFLRARGAGGNCGCLFRFWGGPCLRGGKLGFGDGKGPRGFCGTLLCGAPELRAPHLLAMLHLALLRSTALCQALFLLAALLRTALGGRLGGGIAGAVSR